MCRSSISRWPSTRAYSTSGITRGRPSSTAPARGAANATANRSSGNASRSSVVLVMGPVPVGTGRHETRAKLRLLARSELDLDVEDFRPAVDADGHGVARLVAFEGAVVFADVAGGAAVDAFDDVAVVAAARADGGAQSRGRGGRVGLDAG